MHDPMTQAFQIKYPWKGKASHFSPTGYRSTFITIWHNDPEKDGTDDSCGWFPRARHGNPAVREKVKKRIVSELTGYSVMDKFAPEWQCLFLLRAVYYEHLGGWSKAERWINKNFAKIICDITNPIDSLMGCMKYPPEEVADILYGYVYRQTRPWYKHPRWHVWHWSFQIHPWQAVKRRFWDKCVLCQKRGFPKGVAAMGNWNGDRIWHQTCETPQNSGYVPQPTEEA